MTTNHIRDTTTISRVVRNRSLLVLGFAESVSGVGSWITQIAIFALVVFQDGGGAVEASGVWLAGLGPSLLVSPIAGRLADRFDRRSLMITSELACGLTVLGMVFVSRLDLLYALLALQAVFGALLGPARQAALPGLVAAETLSKANAFLQQLSGIVKVGAPLFAGLVLSLLDPHRAMILDVFSYAISAVILARLPRLPAGRRAQSAAAVDGDVPALPRSSSLIRALRAFPLLRLLFAVRFLSILNIVGFDILYSIYVRDVLRGDAALFGVVVGLIGLGTIGATVGLLTWNGERQLWRDVVVGLVLLGSIPVSLAVASGLESLALARIVVGIGCLLGGAGNGLLGVQVATLLQLLAPRELLGRIGGGAQSTVTAGQLIAVFAIPLIVPGVLSLGVYFGITAFSILLLALGTALVVRRQIGNGGGGGTGVMARLRSPSGEMGG